MFEVGVLIPKDMEKSEILNAFFASIFTSKTVLEQSQAPEARGKVWNETYPNGRKTRLKRT